MSQRWPFILFLALVVIEGGCGRLGYDSLGASGDNLEGADSGVVEDVDAIVRYDAGPSSQTDARVGMPIEWQAIPSGSFQMGTIGNRQEGPVHTVDIQGFALSQTEVTVAQYMECVTAGICSEPDTWSEDCYWNTSGYDDHPVNCVNWNQAKAYCEWVGGRLPSESEWEYAARSAIDGNIYPWGQENASCDYAIISSDGGCGEGGPKPVCSKTAGNSSQGVCDLSGNVWEWVQDTWHSNYNGAPNDGQAWEDSSNRIVRGGDYASRANSVRAAYRGIFFGAPYNNLFLGIRCARDLTSIN